MPIITVFWEAKADGSTEARLPDQAGHHGKNLISIKNTKIWQGAAPDASNPNNLGGLGRQITWETNAGESLELRRRRL